MNPSARVRLVMLALLLLGAAPTASPAEPDQLLGVYSLTSWSDGDGTPLGAVYSIGQDRVGYLWIATDAGLLRFDGVRFTPFEAIGDTALPRLPITALCVARDGSIWAGFAGAGVLRIEGDRVRSENQPQGSLGTVTDLAEDSQGIWAVSDGRLYEVKDGRWQKVALVWNGRDPTVLHLYVGHDGTLWVATAQGGVFRRTGDADRFEHASTGFTWGVSQDAAGAMWTTDIVAGFRRIGATPPLHPFEGSGYRLMHDRRGNLWVATLGAGLWRVRTDSPGAVTVERTALRTGLSSDSVQSLLEDRDGNVWVGTTGGLHRLTERKLRPIANVGFVVDVLPDTSGGSAVAGTTNGLVALSKTTGEWQRARAASGGPDVRTLYRDPSGSLWIGTNVGVWRYVNGTFARVPLPQMPSTATTTITAAAGGGVWLNYGNWLQRWDGRAIEPLRIAPEHDLQRIALAFTDSRERLWIASDDGRIAWVDKTGVFHDIDHDDPHDILHSDRHDDRYDDQQPRRLRPAVYGFFEDHAGVIWVAGSGGLSRIAGDSVLTLTTENGLPGNRVWSVIEDDEEFLWLSIDRGILRIAPAEIAALAANRTRRIQYTLYDTSDGLAGAPLGNIRSTRGADGRLWFVRGGGLTEVDARRLNHLPPLANSPVRIETVTANELRLTPGPRTALRAGTNRLQISYTTVALTAPNKIHFRYRLDGFDTDWVDAGTRRQAFYTNLSPRAYRFRVESSAEDGPSLASTAAWDFLIEPAFYQTNWFYAASIAAAALAVMAAWRVRLRRVRREFSLVLAERARLSREIHDTLLQSLVGVTLQFNAIENVLGPASSAARDLLVRIRRHVEGYIRDARQSIWDLRSPLLETHDLLGALRDFGRRASAGTAAKFTATLVGTPRQCSAKIENQLLRIGQEAITNAVRHAGATRIGVELRFDPGTVTLRVLDDGRGFSHETPSQPDGTHYGLTTMRERAEELGGRLTVASGVGRGTSVETVVPTSHVA